MRESGRQQLVRYRTDAASDVEKRPILAPLIEQSINEKTRRGRGTASAITAQIATGGSRIEQITSVYAVPTAIHEISPSVDAGYDPPCFTPQERRST
jgi:hypothetical protein